MSEHVCHATGCRIPVPPKMLMCRRHWYMVPPLLRAQIWATYRPGQEIDKQPSDEYMEVQRECIKVVARKEGRT